MATTVSGIGELKAKVGEHLGWSDWMEVTQDRVNLFAEATGDHQWIHVDPERARAGPFGGPIAHGYLTLSLVSWFLPRVWRVEGFAMGVNYGLDRVRFPAPVPAGAEVRATMQVVSVDERDDGWTQIVQRFTIEVRGAERPACVADSVVRVLRA